MSPPNGHRPVAEQLREAFDSAAEYQCAFLSHESFGLTQNGRLYLRDLGVTVTGEEAAVVSELIAHDVDRLVQQAEELQRV